MKSSYPIKPIPGYKGQYYATIWGDILSIHNRDFTHLKTSKDKDGYLIVYLSKKGKTIKKRVHRIVAELFVEGKTRSKNEVDHLDKDRGNAAADNLEWVTRKENMRRKALLK